MSMHFLKNKDFFEGVRAGMTFFLFLLFTTRQYFCFNETLLFFHFLNAALIDKDKNPKWNPSSLDAVSQEAVDAYFNPLARDKELQL